MKEKKVITSVQLTVKQKKDLDELARERGIGPSTFLRQIVMKTIREEKTMFATKESERIWNVNKKENEAEERRLRKIEEKKDRQLEKAMKKGR